MAVIWQFFIPISTQEKGNALVKSTYPLLKQCKDIHFVGSIESRDIPFGKADVILTEAFVGNVILKLYEGLSKMILKEIKVAVPKKEGLVPLY